MSCNKEWRWRIATSEVRLALGPFAAVGLPIPNLTEFRDFAQPLMVGDGSQRLYGYSQIVLFWDTLSQAHYHRLREYIEIPSALVYMTIDREDGLYSGEHYIDVNGFAHRPRELQRANSLVARTGPNVFSNVQLLIEGVTVINDPSNYTIL